MEYNLHMNSIIEFSNDCNELEKKGKKTKGIELLSKLGTKLDSNPEKVGVALFFSSISFFSLLSEGNVDRGCSTSSLLGSVWMK